MGLAERDYVGGVRPTHPEGTCAGCSSTVRVRLCPWSELTRPTGPETAGHVVHVWGSGLRRFRTPLPKCADKQPAGDEDGEDRKTSL